MEFDSLFEALTDPNLPPTHQITPDWFISSQLPQLYTAFALSVFYNNYLHAFLLVCKLP